MSNETGLADLLGLVRNLEKRFEGRADTQRRDIDGILDRLQVLEIDAGMNDLAGPDTVGQLLSLIKIGNMTLARSAGTLFLSNASQEGMELNEVQQAEVALMLERFFDLSFPSRANAPNAPTDKSDKSYNDLTEDEVGVLHQRAMVLGISVNAYIRKVLF